MHKLVQAFGLLNPQEDERRPELQQLRPSPAQLRDLSAYHDRDYLERLLRGEVDGATDDTQHTEYGLEEVRRQIQLFGITRILMRKKLGPGLPNLPSFAGLCPVCSGSNIGG